MSTLTLKFDPALDYQTDAVQSIVRVFEGLTIADGPFSMSTNIPSRFTLTEFGRGNGELSLDDEQLLENVRRVQEANGIPKTGVLEGRNFSVEMETGTGKTYVYLKTIFELNRVYGFTKFVIVVPSIPIREGVLASIRDMRTHFESLYTQPFNAILYNSRQLGQVRQFSAANTVQILIMNIQAFQKDVEEVDNDAPARRGSVNVINRESDRMSGHRPIEFIQATHPVVILDEPQNMESEKSKAAIERLNPLCTLRYSATHRDPYNLVYRLSPIDAFDRRLVKSIEVASVRADDNLNDAFIRLERVDAKSGKATVRINVGSGASVSQKSLSIKLRDDLKTKSKGRQEYGEGFIVSEIVFAAGSERIEFANGVVVALGAASGGLDDDVMRSQIRETVDAHLDKELALENRGIKVLTLFFVDRVSHYRIHEEDGSASLGKIGQWFEEIYTEVAAKPKYASLDLPAVDQVHSGYFSKDRRGIAHDTKGNTESDNDTYELIMRDKARLLSLEEPLRFIFSHSALAEGWDNPNVFQICTLRASRSRDRKRQEIGRGLRLPVNQSGEQVRDPQINRLSVIANESYDEFARRLQTEYEEDYGIEFGIVSRIAFSGLTAPESSPDSHGEVVPLGQDRSEAIWEHLRRCGYLDADGHVLETFRLSDDSFDLCVPAEYADIRAAITDTIAKHVIVSRLVNKRDRRPVAYNKRVELNEDFRELWERISAKTRYRVRFSSDDLVSDATKRIRDAERISAPVIAVDVVPVTPSMAGVVAGERTALKTYTTGRPGTVPDVLEYLQNETELTRSTLVKILLESDRIADLSVNPQAFITMATDAVRRCLNKIMVAGIQYEKIAGQVWEMQRLAPEPGKEIERYLSNLYKVQNSAKTVYDHVEVESNIERDFAKALDNNEQVKCFLKLPSWFTVDTPVGAYNPDWAIVYEGEAKVYLVRETKSSQTPEDRRHDENVKIDCGKKHFETIGVDYEVVTGFRDMVTRMTVEG